MKKKIIIGAYILTLLVLGFTVGKGEDLAIFQAIAFPFSISGKILRSMSLASTVGNAFAFILYAVISLLPMAVLVVLKLKKKDDVIDGVMLPMLSVVLFVVLYFYTNPGLLQDLYLILAKYGWNEKYDTILLSGFSNLFYLSLAMYVAIKMIRSKEINYSKFFSSFITLVLAVLLFVIFFVVPSRMTAYDGDPNLGVQKAKHFLEQLDVAIRSGLYIYALILFRKLCIGSSEFSEVLVEHTKKFQKITKVIIIYLISSVLFFTIYQIVFGAKLNYITFYLNIPLFEILVFFLSLFLTTSFIKSYLLSEESKLTI